MQILKVKYPVSDFILDNTGDFLEDSDSFEVAFATSSSVTMKMALKRRNCLTLLKIPCFIVYDKVLHRIFIFLYLNVFRINQKLDY